jgi:cyclophilin family peptidyl-prolyl cis-trans isomerase
MKKLSILLLIIFSISTFSFAEKTKKKKSKKEKNTYVLVSTGYGDMVLKLYNETPLHRDNFKKLVSEKFYDSLLFHRVIKDFMIQGGDPQSKNAKPGQMLGDGEVQGVARIPAEFNPALYHKKGALAAARDGNPEKASSNCQFYIVQGRKFTDADLDNLQKRNGMNYTAEQREMYKNIGGTPHLDNNYTVYGEVVSGMEVIDKIAAVNTASADRPIADRPVEDVRMTMKVLKKYKEKKSR